MSNQSLHQNLQAFEKGISVCIDNKLITPALILIYSAIDMLGWVDSGDADANKNSFLMWTEKYLLTQKAFGCTALDIYAARCGLLHTVTPFSRLYAEKKS
ncbi:MAG: hypothetical protein ABIG11_00750 [bacterium]